MRERTEETSNRAPTSYHYHCNVYSRVLKSCSQKSERRSLKVTVTNGLLLTKWERGLTETWFECRRLITTTVMLTKRESCSQKSERRSLKVTVTNGLLPTKWERGLKKPRIDVLSLHLWFLYWPELHWSGLYSYKRSFQVEPEAKYILRIHPEMKIYEIHQYISTL